ncbi:unnamed protein product [Brachionus calyciflorus]|uniref:NLRC3 n=1 Tax=Brachionus calyciflorus TaxID=104777 RepID=A0A813M2T0_9BILA|nr:unnamed protein product [Brachionus calyciflorus]
MQSLRDAINSVTKLYTDRAAIIQSSIVNPIFGYLLESTGSLDNLKLLGSIIEPKNDSSSSNSLNSSFSSLLLTMFPPINQNISGNSNTSTLIAEFKNNKEKGIEFFAEIFVRILENNSTHELNTSNNIEIFKIIENLMNEVTKIQTFFDVKLMKLMMIHAFIIQALEEQEDLEKYISSIIQKIKKYEIVEIYDLNCDIVNEILKVKIITQSFPYSELNQPPSNVNIPIFDREKKDDLNPFIEDSTFPDCADVLLLNICNCLFYHPEKQSYSYDHLNPASDLAKFYQNHKQLFLITPEIRNEWSRVVQGLDDFETLDKSEYSLNLIVYKREKRNEIKSGVINMMNVLIKIFQIDHEKFWKNFKGTNIEKKLRELFSIITPEFKGRKFSMTFGRFNEFQSMRRTDFTIKFNLIFELPNGSVITMQVEHMTHHAEMNLIEYDNSGLKSDTNIVNTYRFPNILPVTIFKKYLQLLQNELDNWLSSLNLNENSNIYERIFFSGFIKTNQQKKNKLNIIFDHIINNCESENEISQFENIVKVILSTVNFRDRGTATMFKPYLVYSNEIDDKEVLNNWLSSFNVEDYEIYKLWEDRISSIKIESMTLYLYKIQFQSIDAIFKTLKKSKNLKSLKLTGIQLSITNNIFKKLKILKNLTSLDLSGNKLYTVQPKVFSDTLLSLNKLTDLDISENQLEDLDVFEKLINLKSLNISNNYLGTNGISNTLKNLSNLTKLNISSNYIGLESADSVSENLKYLTNLKILNISNNELGDEGTRSISESLKKFQNLTKLDFSGNNTKSSGAFHLAQALKFMKNLTVLKISNNNLGFEGAQYISESLALLQNLTTFDVSSNNVGPKGAKSISQSIKELKDLNHFDFSGNIIDFEGAKDLSNILSYLTKIKYFDISYNKLNNEGIKVITSTLKNLRDLEYINLSNNNISDDGLKRFIELFPSLLNLNTIDLSYNKIGYSGAQSILDDLKILKKLGELNLIRNNIGKDGVNKILNEIEKQEIIVDIGLSFNDEEECIDYKSEDSDNDGNEKDDNN